MSEVELQKKIDDFLQSALRKFIIKDYNEAIRDLKAAEVLDKDNPAILYNIGINYSRLGLYKTAIKYFSRILKLKLTFVDILDVKKLISYACINTGEIKKAIKYLEDVLSTTPDDVSGRNMLGYCLEIQGKYDDAREMYKAIIEIDKENYNAYNSLAYITAKTDGNLQESLRFAQIAHESNQKNPAYLDTIGFIHMKMKNLDTAEQFLKRASELAPLSEEVQQHINDLEEIKKAK
jgi:tetratricopeptide (TPR) repeat protein